jgi:hypothetical protein
MTIVLFITALASGGLTIWMLWPHGAVTALLAAPFVASAVVALAVFAIAAVHARARAQEASGANGVIQALSRLLPR